MSRSALSTSVRRLRGLLTEQHRHEESDEQLLHAFLADRDESAFTVLVRRHGPMVHSVCRRVLGHVQDAEDAFQATFLLLARKAAALRNKAALAGWLHGTAYRTALKAKQAAARRRKHEGQTPARPSTDPAGELLWREVRALLDEEITCLPEIYRSVFVLCCLESLSRTEAARQLGLKEGTLSSRLAEARKRLQQRLTRRGVELTALLAATALATRPASALPPVSLGRLTSDAITPAIAALVENGLRLGKAKVIAAILLTAGMLAGAGVWLGAKPQAAAVPPPVPRKETPVPAAPKQEKKEMVEVRGRVLDPDGKPVKDARLYVPHARKDPPNPITDFTLVQRGVSDAAGRFRIEVPRSDLLANRRTPLVAAADGYGVDWAEMSADDLRGEWTLRLVKDQAIQGRIVNTEGKPLAGVRVGAINLQGTPDGRLDGFLTAWQRDWREADRQTPKRLHRPLDKALPPVLTDRDGRFRITGVGAERVVVLQVRGRGIGTTSMQVIARAGFNPATLKAGGFWKADPLYGPTLECVVTTGQTIEGVVREAGNGKPVPGFTISVLLGDDTEHTVSDGQGRYRLTGIARRESYSLMARAPANSSWLWSGKNAKAADGIRPLQVDFTVARGVVVTGRIREKKTGVGVPGWVSFMTLPDNTFAAKDAYASTLYDQAGRRKTDAEGRFRMAVVPGPVVLLAGADAVEKANGGQRINPYKQAELDDADRKRVKVITAGVGSRYAVTFGGSLTELNDRNSIKYLDAAPDAAATCDLTVDRGKTLTVKIEDKQGKPLTGSTVAGIADMGPNECVVPTDRVTVYALDPNKPGWLPFVHPKRQLLFLHPKRRLAGTLSVRGDEKETPVVRLVPTGTVTGRLLDGDGHPLAGVDVEAGYTERAGQLHEMVKRLEPLIRTEKDGRFRLEGVTPGLKFAVIYRRGRTFLAEERRSGLKRIESGQTLDLGDIRTKPVRIR